MFDHLDDYRSVYAACPVIGPKAGVGAKSLRSWMLQPRGWRLATSVPRPLSSSASRIWSGGTAIWHLVVKSPLGVAGSDHGRHVRRRCHRYAVPAAHRRARLPPTTTPTGDKGVVRARPDRCRGTRTTRPARNATISSRASGATTAVTSRT